MEGSKRDNRWVLLLYKVEKTFCFCDWFLFKRQCIYSSSRGCNVLNKVWERGTAFSWKMVYSCFEKGCRKKCTRQSRKVLWVVLSALFSKEIWKNGTRGHGHMFASAPDDFCVLEVQVQIKWRLCEQKLLLGHIPFGEQTSPCSDYSQVSTQELIFYSENLDSESDYAQKLIFEQLLCLLFDRQWTKIDKLAAICSYFVIKHLCKQINNPPLSVINYSSNL